MFSKVKRFDLSYICYCVFSASNINKIKTAYTACCCLKSSLNCKIKGKTFQVTGHLISIKKDKV